MQLIEKGRLLPGMVLGQDVYNSRHQIVVGKGTVLTESVINRLQKFSVLRVFIDDNALSGPAGTNELPSSSRSARVVNTPEFKEFQRSFDNEVKNFRVYINEVLLQNDAIDTHSLYDSMTDLLDNASNTLNAFEMIQSLKRFDDVTYSHSINVALLSNIFARWLGFSEDQIEIATISGLLHDIGKLRISAEIIKKPGRLTKDEYKKIKEYPQYGYMFLKDKNIDPHIKNAVLLHQERCDGSGYPFSITGDRIDPFAKIIAITDVFDAMTSPRVYKEAKSPFEVIELFEKDGYTKFESKYLLVFLKRVADSYINENVRLNDGTEGRVIFINNHALSRPTLISGDRIIDLNEMPELMIKEII
ncbi:MAG: HD-GYP domain-containing protein [Lachnospiraceae bacterium]|jgi:HD-GYP domain-containing protein (c-di-GMP phosphodiesterase class II)|nr:HD-GYP domain-containing protein [Lachnospiraceae bacterium]MEE3461672.1 HD-GYP domain-containing protein [Lachnospiraceae bacterium]